MGGGGGDGFRVDIKLDIISITVKLQSMTMNEFSKWEHVKYEEEGTKYRMLGDTLGQRSTGRDAVVLMIGKVEVSPGKGWASDEKR